MITKIHMEGVASYLSATHLETDKKVNLIYGLNGTGKSTISNFLYDRTNLDYTKCSADIGENELVLVYNQRFIHDNFYVADGLKGIFSLSKENKDIEEQIKVAEGLLAKAVKAEELAATEISLEEERLSRIKSLACDITWAIKKDYTGGDRVLEFCLDNLKGKKETLFDHLASITRPSSEPTKNIEQIKREVEAIHGDSAQKYAPLPALQFSEHAIEDDDIYTHIIVGSKDSPAAPLIEKLQNSDWVRSGLKFLPSPNASEPDVCPFCQQKTITQQLAKEIENYFDQSFADSIQLITKHFENYNSAASELLPLEIYNSNPIAKERTAELLEKHATLKNLLQSNIAKIEKKKSLPSVPASLSSTKQAIRSFNKLIEEINKNIHLHNSRIDNCQSELKTLKSQFWSLMRWKYDQAITSWITGKSSSDSKISAAKLQKNTASAEATAKRQEIANLQKSTVNIDSAITAINQGLTHLGITDFSIKKHNDSLYRIVRSEDTEARFASLSEGEKMIISFLYFCELCRGKKSPTETVQKRIAVIDDPISSLSHIFVFNIGRMLKAEFFQSNRFEQVFVLTHSLYFFYELTETNKDKRKKEQGLFRLSKNHLGSSIKTMHYEEIQNDYHSYWLVVSDPNQPPALIANCMRNIIEYFFNFVQKADFSNVIQKPELQENRYQAFCRYINRESHSLGQNIFDYKEFNYDDFRDGLRLVFVTLGYEEHYKKMTQTITP